MPSPTRLLRQLESATRRRDRALAALWKREASFTALRLSLGERTDPWACATVGAAADRLGDARWTASRAEADLRRAVAAYEDAGRLPPSPPR